MTLQTVSGKAFEYQLGVHLADRLKIPFISSSEKTVGERAFGLRLPTEQVKLVRAADEASVFVICHDSRFKNAASVELQDDIKGKQGDVRDLVVKIAGGVQIGISAKNRHDAIKHSRLSDKIDFGKEWAGYPVSSAYKKMIGPVFQDLREKKKQAMLFREIPDKVTRYYLPILIAFEDELQRLCESYGQDFVRRMFQYLLGTYDFYKIIKDNGTVAIQSFNMGGSLSWGKKWKIPDRIEAITRKRDSLSTLIVSFVGGWQLSFRIHNASSKVEPSLKFDIRFIGLPQSVARHEITLLSSSDEGDNGDAECR